VSAEYQEHVQAAFPHRVEVGTIPGAGGSTFVVVGFTLETNGYKACFALTTIEAQALSRELANTAAEVEGL
jgi:hypothetical protein